jgi:hypothetical protein
MLKIINILFITLVIFSCSLERNNPLDPVNSGIKEPARVVVHELPLTSYGSVLLEWELQSDATGYYVYRSMSYNGYYSRIATVVPSSSDDVGFYEDFSDELVSETWYFYKVSAYNTLELEGYSSHYTYTYYTDGSSY